NEIELFEILGSDGYSLGKLGDFFRFQQRPILYKNFIYHDTLGPEQRKEYLFFVNQVGHTFILPIKIFSDKKFRSVAFNDYLLDGFTYGILLFVAVLSLFFFLSSRYYLYLYYGLYILTAIAWFLSYFGLGYQYIWGNYPFLNTAMAPVMASLNILLNLKICQILIKIPKSKRVLGQLMTFIKYSLLALTVFPLIINLNNHGYGLNHLYLIAFLFTILLSMIIVLYSVINHALKGNIAAKLYLIASILKAGSIINLALLELGVTPALDNMEGLLQIGIFIEIALLTFALALRYSSFKAGTFVKVIEAHENERARISKEIHDGISSSLTGINYGIKNFMRDIGQLPLEKKEHLNKIFDELNKVQLEARSISHNTMPDYIKKSSLTTIVEKYIEELQHKTNHKPEGDFIKINFSANEQQNSFSEVVKLNVFRIVQEILTNVLKHSKANKAEILFSFSKTELMIIAEDDGLGYYHQSGELINKGMGVKNMETRVKLLDGSFEIKSPVYHQKAGQTDDSASHIYLKEFGTMIKIKIPYRDNLLHNKKDYDY
ncbi:MAG: 7TM diverse intracellular signaling domain-containing protein, partial [Ferruginibacter sp.]